jgi:hypothetical protein
MNGAAAKQSRREIRRAFGPEAVNVISTQGANLQTLAADFYSYRTHVESQLADLFAHNQDRKNETQRFADFKARTRRERLRWLVLGR